jgi:hypothetical protein
MVSSEKRVKVSKETGKRLAVKKAEWELRTEGDVVEKLLNIVDKKK